MEGAPLEGNYVSQRAQIPHLDHYKDHHPAITENAVEAKFAAEEKTFHMHLPHFLLWYIYGLFLAPLQWGLCGLHKAGPDDIGSINIYIGRRPHFDMLSKSLYDPIPGQNLQLIINGFVVTQSITRWIYHQISGYDMKVYLQDKHDWNRETWDLMDQYDFEKAIKSRPPTMQQQTSKCVNGWWNTGTQRQEINKLDFILCPRCKRCRETTDHVLCCSQLLTITQAHRNTLKTAITSITPDTIANMIVSIQRQLSTAPNQPPD
jgi:hypothetical protein